MSEELQPTELLPVDGKTEQDAPIPLEEQVSMELVKHNYTEAKLQEFEEYLKLDIVDDDKESYLIIKDKRKEVKSYRVAVEKFCKFKREDAVKIQKVWVANENKLVAKLSKVEEHLEAKEKAYEKKIAEEKEARKRKQEEQLITRQQTLAAMGVLYSEGNFVLGEVSFDFSLIKESEEDVWQEAIFPKFKEQYENIQAEQIEKERLQQEAAAELKRQQEELEQTKKQMAEKEAELRLEANRQAADAKAAREVKEKSRMDQLIALGLKFDFVDHFIGYDCFVPIVDIMCHDDEKWAKLIEGVTAQVKRIKEEEAEEIRKEQERKDLQAERLNELLPYNKYGEDVDMATLWSLTPGSYIVILQQKKEAFEKEQEKERQRIADDAAKAERERIEEEQRQTEVQRKADLKRSRMAMLSHNNLVYHGDDNLLGEISEDTWVKDFNELKSKRDEDLRKQEEERKAEELAKASEKVKWAAIISQLSSIEIPKFISGQYAKKAAILREKLEEIKSL